MNTVKKITLLVVAAAVVLGCIFVAGCTDTTASAKPTLTISVEKDAGFAYNIGDQFSITLPSNPSTGYSWKVTSVADGLKYEEVATASESTQTLGAPSTQKFVFTTTQEGYQPFEISYIRSGDEAGIYVYSDFLLVSKDADKNSGSFVYDGTYVPTVGDTIQVKVAGNPASTGYVWTLLPSDGLTVVKEEFIAANSELLGAKGMYVWTLTASQPGTYEIIGKNARSGSEEDIGGFFLPVIFQPKLS